MKLIGQIVKVSFVVALITAVALLLGAVFFNSCKDDARADAQCKAACNGNAADHCYQIQDGHHLMAVCANDAGDGAPSYLLLERDK